MKTGISIHTLLVNNAACYAQLATRVYPIAAPPNPTLPYVTYEVTDTEPEEHKGNTEVDRVRVEVVAYSNTYETAANLGVLIREALDRQTYTDANINVRGIYYEDTAIQTLDTPRRFATVVRVVVHQFR